VRRILLAAVAAALVALLAAAIAWRDALARAGLEVAAGRFLQSTVTVGAVQIGPNDAVIADLRAVREGITILAIPRVTIRYDLRDLLPGSTRRFGLRAVVVEAPHVALVRDRRGRLLFPVPSAAGPGLPSGPAWPNEVPLRWLLRIDDGTLMIADREESAQPLRVRRIEALVSVDTAGRTTYRVAARLLTGTLHGDGVIDHPDAFMRQRWSVPRLPLAPLVDTLVGSAEVRLERGELEHLRIAWDGPLASGVPLAAFLDGRAELRGGVLRLIWLRDPVRDLGGPVALAGGTVYTPAIHGSLEGIALHARGGIFWSPARGVALRIEGNGPLERLRGAIGALVEEPIAGQARLRLTIEGSLDDPLLGLTGTAQRASYGPYPLEAVAARLWLRDGHLAVLPLHTSYGGIGGEVTGALDLGDHLETTLVLTASAPAARFPYVGRVAGLGRLSLAAVLDGRDAAVEATGRLGTARAAGVTIPFSFGSDGRDEIGPFLVRSAGGTAAGDLRIDRPHDRSAFWLTARNLRLRRPSPGLAPGAALPEIMAAGELRDLRIAGGGPGQHPVVAGRLAFGPGEIAALPVRDLQARVGGVLPDASLVWVLADGPWGRFSGSGTVGLDHLRVAGEWVGDLAGLRPLVPMLAPHGRARGRVILGADGRGLSVEGDDVQFAGARLAGIPVSEASGVVRFTGSHVSVARLDAVLPGGGRLVGAGPLEGRGMALIATELRPTVLQGLGIPVTAGSGALAGRFAVDAGVPRFTGGIALRGGIAAGAAVAGSGMVRVDGRQMTLSDVAGLLDGIPAFGGGTVVVPAAGPPEYDLSAAIPAGEIGAAERLLAIPQYARGTFATQRLAIRGRGLRPEIMGAIRVPVARVHGLYVEGGHAVVAAGAEGITFSDGSIRAGETSVAFHGLLREGEQALALDAPRARLSDFDDLFDTGEMLGGSGRVALAVVARDGRLSTAADVAIAGLRYRNAPFGDVRAVWSGERNDVKGRLAVTGPGGDLAAEGEARFTHAASLPAILARSRYDLRAHLRGLDLSLWSAIAGFPQLPILGRLDADGSISGRAPALRANATMLVRDGSFAGERIDELGALVAADSRAITVRDVRAAVAGVTASGQGRLDLSPPHRVAFTLRLHSDDLPAVLDRIARAPVPVTGTVDATLAVGGTIGAPRFDAVVSGEGMQLYGVAVPSLLAAARLDGDLLAIRDLEARVGGGRIEGAGTLPLRLRPFALGAPNEPVAFDLAIRSVDPSFLDPILGAGTRLGGALDGHVGLTGTIGKPRVVGRLEWRDGRVVSDLETIPLEGVRARLDFSGQRIRLGYLDGRLGSGSIDGRGEVDLSGGVGALEDLAYRFSFAVHDAQVESPRFGSSTVDGMLSLGATQGTRPLIAGGVVLTHARIPFAAFVEAARGGGSTLPPVVDPAFDLSVEAGQDVRVRGAGFGFGLDVGGRGAVHLAGTLRDPKLDGVFTATDGTLTYVDRLFRLENGTLRFRPSDGTVPRLAVTAAARVPNPDPDPRRNPYGVAEITIRLDGPLDALRVGLSSDPPGYTRDQLIAMLSPFGGFAAGISFANGTPAVQIPGMPAGSTPEAGTIFPGGLPPSTSGSLTVGQEAFNLINAQFTAALLAPVESALGRGLGLSGLDVSVGYYGEVRVSVRRQLGRRLSAVYAATFGIPYEQTLGIQYQAGGTLLARLSVFSRQGLLPLLQTPASGSLFGRVTGIPTQGTQGVTFVLDRLFP
jgi:hypothetical protein